MTPGAATADSETGQPQAADPEVAESAGADVTGGPVPAARPPAVVAAFEGWNDAGDAATGAVEHLELTWDARLLTEIDPEDFYDFQVNRPTVTLVEGVTRRLTWPTTLLSVCRPPGSDRDILLIRGIEPNMRWRAFCTELLDICTDLGADQFVWLGALLADTPHTRPVPVTGTSYDSESAARFGTDQSRYEGPTGIIGVLQDECVKAGVPAVTFWAALPHYISQGPHPMATLALLHRIEEVLDMPVPVGALPQQAEEWQRMVDETASEDEEITEYVRRLEQKAGTPQLRHTSGESLAQEAERYLRRRGPGSGSDGP
ncbi:MAG: PAC2 family protein [Mycobacteriales bacterium]